MAKETSPKVELGFSISLIVLSVVIFRETLSLPPGTFDPVTNGHLSLINPAASATANDAVSPTFRQRPDLALWFYALSVVYVATLALKVVNFGICTVLFLLISIAMLTRFYYKRLPIALLIALVIGFGCQYIFTQVFVLDLP